MLAIKDLYKSFKIGEEKEEILKGINLEILQGEFVSIVGSSGCGKTTLLNIISGIDNYTSGEISFWGKSSLKFNDDEWSNLRKNTIGYIFQNFNLIDYLTAQENVIEALRLNGVSKHKAKDIAGELLKKVGMGGKKNNLPNQLSGGQKQRVAIARALANQPQIILADEPTGALDSKTSKEIIKLLRDINKESGITIILITHDMGIAEESDRIITMNDGCIINDDKKNEFKKVENIKENPQKRLTLGSVVKLALKNMAIRKRRIAFTSIGTAIGLLGALLLIGIGTGVKDKLQYELNFFVDKSSIYIAESDVEVASKIEDTVSKVDNVKNVYPYYIFGATYGYKDIVSSASISSMDPLNQLSESMEDIVLEGKMPSSDSTAEMVIPKDMAKALMGEKDYSDIIGQKITMLFTLIGADELSYQVPRDCVVCGISDSSFMGASFIYIPHDFAKQIAIESSKNEDYIASNFRVIVKSLNKINKTKEELQKMYSNVTTDEDDMEKLMSYIDIGTTILAIISSVSVVIAIIMISLVMYMTVSEQTRVIGILRALGARKKEIKRMFITEGAAIGFVSGLMGVIMTIFIGFSINFIMKIAFPDMAFELFQIKLIQILSCMLFSIVICGLASYNPAKKAAKMNPVEALGFFQ